MVSVSTGQSKCEAVGGGVVKRLVGLATNCLLARCSGSHQKVVIKMANIVTN